MNKLMWLVFAQAAVSATCRPGATSDPTPVTKRVSVASPSKGAMKPAVASPGKADPRLRSALERVARCFHRAVAVLQREPQSGRLGAFLERAGASGRLEKSCLTAVRSTVTGAALTPDGHEIRVQRSVQGEDHFDGGRTVLHIRYQFGCHGCAASAKTMIERSFGGKP